MPWAVQQPEEIASRAAAIYGGAFPDFQPTAPNTVATTHCRVLGMAAFDLYGYQAYIAQELFPDTTQDNLDRQAAIWGLTRLPPVAASGVASAPGASGTVIPSGTTATDPLGNAYFTTAAVTLGASGAVVSVQAATPGAQGNWVAGTVLTLLSPISGLSAQTLTVLGTAVATASILQAGIAAGQVLLDAAGNSYTTTASVEATESGVPLDFVAASPTSAAALAPGAVLTPSPEVLGIPTGGVVVSNPGLSGGAPAETNTALRGRLLARIRARGRGGNVADYQFWATSASSLVQYVQVVPNMLGPGSVGVYVAGAGPSALSTVTVAEVQSAVAALAPVTANVTVAAATAQPYDATVHLIQDTMANRAAATAAFQAWIAQDGAIGGTLYLQRFEAALGGAGGAFATDVQSPTGDVPFPAGVVPVAGVLAFV